MTSSALCLELKALESKGVIGAGMKKIWLLAKVRENFRLLRVNRSTEIKRVKGVKLLLQVLGQGGFTPLRDLNQTKSWIQYAGGPYFTAILQRLLRACSRGYLL